MILMLNPSRNFLQLRLQRAALRRNQRIETVEQSWAVYTKGRVLVVKMQVYLPLKIVRTLWKRLGVIWVPTSNMESPNRDQMESLW